MQCKNSILERLLASPQGPLRGWVWKMGASVQGRLEIKVSVASYRKQEGLKRSVSCERKSLEH